MSDQHTGRAEQRRLESLSPFELKGKLIELADSNQKREAIAMVNAGRGNPNWTATSPREAFFQLGLFSVEECRRDWDEFADLGGMPQKDGIAARLDSFLGQNADAPGAAQLRASVAWATGKLGLDPDEFVGELSDAVVGDHYPMPDRMLVNCEKIVHAYLAEAMGGAPEGGWDLFAVEGGTAAMCYLFDSAQVNGLLAKGDKIAIMTPIFTPYLEIPHLDRYDFEVVELKADKFTDNGFHAWQYSEAEIDKLRDPSIKALFCVNPSNPPSVKLTPDTMNQIAQIVKDDNPNLVIITDDVYGTFVDGFQSLMSVIPRNTLGVYSFSKYFGCTGWRLGVIAVGRNNIFDPAIAALPQDHQVALNRRYSTISLEPENLKFVDRLVADSRDVALNHTAGLSTPQQVQMALFSLHCLMDAEDQYRKDCQAIIARRMQALTEALDVDLPDDTDAARYYIELDLLSWASQHLGEDFADWMRETYEPTDPIFRLAEQASVVLLNGGGFSGPEWSVRVSMANLPKDAYTTIGSWLRRIGDEYQAEYANRG
ncbi:bifunctional aspartate transaminase/aspartate 4-decarboxylase [Glycomyces buryatensis]|uniref:Bifunctional aspartate transaminase/aspartate 4-decarboxylase n=1 Tax=Glycomyces buryatensis TaxID=2570927 RepID=A0A4S8PPF9_9ACTN|nr:bifunctional aspartate transaminase/aspartate 4-decarboxylase [Glycomyces buryatensis]THV32888.1 bifunctional aspartate transaminase/aspartate 4-decarboxylase [Glycomyces buryatensis]